jgi:epoxyqueuosine reductase
MLTKTEVIAKAYENGFADIGFTTAQPFESHKAFLTAHQKEYGWCETAGMSLLQGTAPKKIMPEAEAIIVLMEAYIQKAFPVYMEGHFGRCYLDDDRVTRDRLAPRIKAFRGFLRDNGIQSKASFNLPQRMAAARAGMGTFGKNCLFYSRQAARQSSWILPVTILVDRAFEPDPPVLRNGCPDWCRNACIAACPTRALKGNGTIDPTRCISYLTYYGDGLTPEALREPMGLYVYGCDRCQAVCPRNTPWLAADRPMNPKVAAMEPHFQLERLLDMDKCYYEEKIWPHMFYMPSSEIWRWQMNAARAMGNTLDPRYIPDLKCTCRENTDERVRAMAAWALGRIGGQQARQALLSLQPNAQGIVLTEIESALERASVA